MAVFTCEKCGNNVDTRCKPKKCTACGEDRHHVQGGRPPPRPKKRRNSLMVAQASRRPEVIVGRASVPARQGASYAPFLLIYISGSQAPAWEPAV